MFKTRTIKLKIYCCAVYLQLLGVIAAAQQPKLMIPIGHSDAVNTAACSADGKIIASASIDKILKLWDCQSGKLIRNLEGQADIINSIVFTNDGKYIIAGSSDKTIRIWEITSGKIVKTLSAHADVIIKVIIDSSNQLLASLSVDQVLCVWDLNTGALKYKLNGRSNMQFNRNGNYLLTTSTGGMANVLGATTGKIKYTLNKANNQINKAGFSPDGNYIVSADKAGKINLWLADEGKIIKEADLYKEQLTALDFTAGGKMFITGFDDGTVQIMDTKTLSVKTQTRIFETSIKTISVAPNDSLFLATSINRFAIVGNLKTGKVVYGITGHEEPLTLAGWNNKENQFFTAANDGLIKIWNAADGRNINTLDGPALSVQASRISPDGKKMVMAYRNGKVVIWSLTSGKSLFVLDHWGNRVTALSFDKTGTYLLTCSRDRKSRLWAMQTGKLLHTFEGHAFTVFTAMFSQDNRYIFTASSDNTIKVWDAVSFNPVLEIDGTLANLKHVNPISNANYKISTRGNIIFFRKVTGSLTPQTLTAHLAEISSINFNSSKTKIVSASFDKTIKVWNVETKQNLLTLEGHTDFVYAAKFSPDDKYIISVSRDRTAKVWDANSGKLLHTLTGHKFSIFDLYFSKDGKRVTTISRSGGVKEWFVETGALLHSISQDYDYKSFITLSNDGKSLATTNFLSSELNVYNLSDGSLINRLTGHKQIVNSARFFNQDKYLLSTSEDGSFCVWNVATGELIKKILAHKGGINTATISHNEKWLITTAKDSSIKKWDLNNYCLLSALKQQAPISSSHLSKDGKYIYTCSNNGNFCRWKTDGLTEDFKINLGENFRISDLSEEFNLFTAIKNVETGIFNLSTGKKYFSMWALKNENFLVKNDQGHYDGTADARKELYFTCGKETIALDQVKDQLWVPNLAERILNNENINAKTLTELEICGLIPETETLPGTENEFRFRIKPQRGGLGKTMLLINDIPCKEYSKENLTNRDGFYELTVPKSEIRDYLLQNIDNYISIKSYTADNAIQSRGLKVYQSNTLKETLLPNLYIISIGVSDYKGDELDLKYAAKDANDISKAIASVTRKFLNIDDKQHVFQYNLTTAKNRYLLPEKKAIQQTLEEIGAKTLANDIVLLFFAGHGVIEGEQKQFYFLTADASKNSPHIADVGISTAELAAWMQPSKMKAQKRILILDACNSGQAIQDFVKLGDGNQNYTAARSIEKGQLIKVIDKLNEKSGLFILSASSSNQSAYELSRYSQGLLTYSLLRAIKQQPDILEQGGFLNVGNWFDAAEKSVTELAQNNGARQDPQIVRTNNFTLGVVDNDVREGIIMASELPIFIQSNFQNSNAEIEYDDLDLSNLVNIQLNEISSRGTESKLAFSGYSGLSDAYQLSGRYQLTENNIIVKVNIIKNKKVVHSFKIKGSKDKLDDFVRELVNMAAKQVN